MVGHRKSSKHLVTAAAALMAVTLIGCGTPNQTQSTAGSPSTNTSEGTTGQSANAPQAGNAASNSQSGSSDTNTSGGIAIGQTAPNFALLNINGSGTVTLQQLLKKGKPILINAWASWCPPCNMETPDLVKMSQKYGNKVQFVGLNLTTIDKVANAKTFVNHYGIPYLVLLDPQGSFSNAYGVMAEPTTFLISPKGKILNIHVGMMTSSEMEQLIQSAL